MPDHSKLAVSPTASNRGGGAQYAVPLGLIAKP